MAAPSRADTAFTVKTNFTPEFQECFPFSEGVIMTVPAGPGGKLFPFDG